MMARTLAPLVILAALAGAPILAQETATQETATQDGSATAAPELPLGEEIVDGIAVGTIYEREKFGDWTLRCTRTADGKDPCHLYQLMQDDKGNSVAEINLFPLSGDDLRVAGATIAVPLGTLLTEQLKLSVDGSSTKRYPFTYCSVQGCYARIGLTAEDIAAFKRGSAAVLSIVPVAAPNARVDVSLSLNGFTKAFDTLLEAQDDAAAE